MTAWSMAGRLDLWHRTRRRGRPSGTGRTWPATAVSGGCGSATGTPGASCSPTRPEPSPTWPGATAGPRRAGAWATPRRTATGDTATLVAGLSGTGLVVPLVLDGPMTGEASLAHAEQSPAPGPSPPTRWPTPSGPSRAAGAGIMHLPPYSSDLSPVELAFSKFKRLLRTAAARAVDVPFGRDRRRTRPLLPGRLRELPAALRTPTARAVRS